MTTTVASYGAQPREDSSPQWLGWVSMGFLGLNLLLLIAVLFLWRYRLPASVETVREETAPIVSSAAVAPEVESLPPAQSRQGDIAGSSIVSRISEPKIEESAPAAKSVTTNVDTEMGNTSSLSTAVVEVHEAPASVSPKDADPQPAAPRHVSGTSGDIDIFDVVRYASSTQRVDVNGDGVIDIRDLIALDSGFNSRGQ